MSAELDRFYQLLDEGITTRRLAAGLPPIQRIKRSDLESLAATRAVEARQQVGLDGSELIVHPSKAELRTRLNWPATSDAGELATWNYLWSDPVRAAVDIRTSSGALFGLLNSEPHRTILLESYWTHWGAGIHREFKPGEESNPLNERWYFIIEIGARPPAPLDEPYNGFGDTYGYPIRVAFEGGAISGYQFAPDGRVLKKKTATWTKRSGATAGRRAIIPGRPGVWLLIVDGVYANHWVREGTVFALPD